MLRLEKPELKWENLKHNLKIEIVWVGETETILGKSLVVVGNSQLLIRKDAIRVRRKLKFGLEKLKSLSKKFKPKLKQKSKSLGYRRNPS